MDRKRIKSWMASLLLMVCSQVVLTACSAHDYTAESDSVKAIADKVWAFSQGHPDGFTLDIRTMTEPTEGIAVSYAATQNSHLLQYNSATQLAPCIQGAQFVGEWSAHPIMCHHLCTVDSNRFLASTQAL